MQILPSWPPPLLFLEFSKLIYSVIPVLHDLKIHTHKTCFDLVQHSPQHFMKGSLNFLLHLKVQTCIPFSVAYTMSKQRMNCLTYSPCPEDCGEDDISKDIITGPSNNDEQNNSIKILIWYIMENDRLRGGGIVFNSLLTLKKGTKASDFRYNELYPIQSLYDYQFHKKTSDLYTNHVRFLKEN